MSDFGLSPDIRNEILGMVPGLKSEAEERARQQQIDEEAKREAQRVDREKREAAQKIGKQAADLLVEHGIPSVPIWNSVPDHTDRFGNPQFQSDRNGWHVVSKVFTYEGSVAMGSTTWYSLDEDGKLQSFTNIGRPKSDSLFGPKDSSDGIIGTEDLQVYDLSELVKSDLFKRGVANLIAGLGPYTETSGS